MTESAVSISISTSSDPPSTALHSPDDSQREETRNNEPTKDVSSTVDALIQLIPEKTNELSKLTSHQKALHEEAVRHALSAGDGPSPARNKKKLFLESVNRNKTPKRKQTKEIGSIELLTESETASTSGKKRCRPKGSLSPENSDTDNNNSPKKTPKKRGRPKLSTSLHPDKKRAPGKLSELPPSDQKTLNRAKEEVSKSIQHRDNTLSELEKAQKALERARKKVEIYQRELSAANDAVEYTISKYAEDMLIEPTPWNFRYKGLQQWHSQHGNISFRNPSKKPGIDLNDQVKINHGVPNMIPEEQEAWIKKYVSFSRFLKLQRQIRRKDKMVPYRVELLNRLGIEWNPKLGVGPEKWAFKYDMLKQYSQEFGTCYVPKTYNMVLHNFMRSCKTQYNERRRKGLEKDPPHHNSLSNERIALLEAIGIEWSESYEVIPWDEHYQQLCRYKEQFGHAAVKWRDPERLGLANWVVGMRERYMNRKKGNPSTLTEEQIEKMECIGFEWSTGGTLKYNRDVVQNIEEVDMVQDIEEVDIENSGKDDAISTEAVETEEGKVLEQIIQEEDKDVEAADFYDIDNMNVRF